MCIRDRFYIDANTGTIFTQNDVDVYIKKYNFKNTEQIYLPLSNQEIVLSTIESLIMMYDELQDHEKSEELNKIVLFRGL